MPLVKAGKCFLASAAACNLMLEGTYNLRRIGQGLGQGILGPEIQIILFR